MSKIQCLQRDNGDIENLSNNITLEPPTGVSFTQKIVKAFKVGHIVSYSFLLWLDFTSVNFTPGANCDIIVYGLPPLNDGIVVVGTSYNGTRIYANRLFNVSNNRVIRFRNTTSDTIKVANYELQATGTYITSE